MLKNSKSVPIKNLQEYFTQDVTLKLPPWQREYSWVAENDGQIGQLLSDLKSFAEDENQEEYLLGSVIFCDDSNSNTYLIIDGQQRTVTLSLLLFAVSKYLTKNKLFKNTSELHKHLQSEILSCLSRSKENYEPRVLFNQVQANEILNRIRDWSNSISDSADDFLATNDSQTKTQKNLLSAINYINYRISDEKEKWIEDHKLADAFIKILSKVKILQLNLDRQSEAISVFDRINNRGLPLNNSDLIKNQIFQRVSDHDFEEISNNWLETSSILASSKIPRLGEIQYLLRAFTWTLDTKKTSYDQLFNFFAGPDNSYLEKNDSIKFSEELMYLAEDLINFSVCKHKKFEVNFELQELYLPQFLGSVQHYPVLLAGRNIKNAQVFSYFLHQVSMRTALYVFAQERPPIFESMVPIWANKIREAGEEVSVQELNNIFEDPNNKIKPSDELVSQLEKNIFEWDIENAIHKKKIRAALSYLSWYFNFNWQQRNDSWTSMDFFRTRKKKGEKKGWDIDHVFAINLANSDSKEELKLINSIGNLTLLAPPDNRSQKDASPIDKKQNYHGSSLLLTKSLVQNSVELSDSDKKDINKINTKFKTSFEFSIDNWNLESIKNRQIYLKNLLVDLLTLKIK